MEDGISEVLSSVVDDVSHAVNRNVGGAQLLQELLGAPWLHALLQMYECLLQFKNLTPGPILPYASGLSHEALLSSHDSVAQSDYGPVLPPLPDDLPEDEEAVRIVCLVKNNQPLSTGSCCLCPQTTELWKKGFNQSAPSVFSPASRAGSFTEKSKANGGEEGAGGSSDDYAYPPPPIPAYSISLPNSPALYKKGATGGQSRNVPTPGRTPSHPGTSLFSVHTAPSSPAAQRSTRQQGVNTLPSPGRQPEPRSKHHDEPLSRPLMRHYSTAPRHNGSRDQPKLTQNETLQSNLCERPRPPELTKQCSVEELRSTVQTVASSIEHSTHDVRHLGHKMVAATELITDSVEENTQALNLLAEVVDKLQGLIVASKHPKSSPPHRPRQRTPPPPPPRVSSISPKVVRKPPTPYPRNLSSSSSSRSSSSSSSSSPSSCADGFPPSRSPKRLNGGSKRSTIHSQGTILFKVIPKAAQSSSSQKPVYMRAMVDYFPQQDSSIPCPDAGMAFSRGDLLEVVDQSDGQWWQARKLPCAVSCAGLIPSASMLKSKHREQWWCEPLQIWKKLILVDEADSDVTDGIYLAGFRRTFRLWRRTSYRKRRQSCTSCSPSSSTLSSPYEEVALYQRPPQENHRLIILVGASGVGVSELRKRLIKLNPSTFQGPVPHTTRPMGAGEQTGREYHFVTKELFEYMVCNHRGHLYGTSTDAIDDVLKRGRMCVIDVEPHSIQPLRTRKLKPYVIFIKAPGPERLRQTRRHARLITNCSVNRAFTEDDFVELEEASRLMEAKYKHFFDCVLVNDDLQDACMQLCSVIQQAQEEPQWIPSIQPLRTRKLKPYVIFIKAPGPERLRQTRRHARLITNCSVNRAFTEDDFVELEEASRLMEAKYKHFFDCVLVNDDLQDACMQLCSVIQQAQEEPQWIPVSWGRPEE
ncbi:hypothetical protein F2P81_021619 [Scophthalmus maximus]|uniref:MAGUK p55 subfamily member 4-like n=1 Tax=Scophthalmus maximus TaxID=52904 RepID=A0A6A4S6N1_SCOMX|nr:hypothetical protein F2P81_021619 [Scophthalmus maximus]